MTKHRKKLLDVTGIFIILIAMMVSQVYTYVKTCQIIHFKYVQFILCQLYCNKAFVKMYSPLCIL